MLQNRRLEAAGGSCPTQLVGELQNGRDVRGNLLGVYACIGVAVNEQAVAAQHGGRLDAVKAAKGRYKVANGGHRHSGKGGTPKVTSKDSQVKAISLDTRCPRPLASGVPRPVRKLSRASRALAAVLAFASLAACGPDPFAPRANSPNADVSHQLWALTGAPVNYPSAIVVAQRLALRLDASGSFDFAFDINPSGQVVMHPVARVVQPLGGARRIGLIRSTEPYESITEAPRDGWQVDSTQVLDVGDVVLVRVQTQFCAFDFSQEVYAKYRVDSIFPAERRLRLSGRVNPNCGFRSFADGLPEF